MPWCPKCKLEYRDGFRECNDCNVELVKELESGDEELVEYDSKAFLTSVSDDITAKIIEAKLKDNGIPVLIKHRGAGGYLSIYMGSTNLGVDVYVPSKLLDRAKEIISIEIEEGQTSILINSESEEDNEILIKEENKYQKKKKLRGWLILLLIIPGFIWLAFSMLRMLIQVLSFR